MASLPVSDIIMKARQYLAELEDRLMPDKPALATYNALIKDYLQDAINDMNFYAGLYRLHLANNSLDLLPALLQFLPASWKNIDLTELNTAIEQEWMREVGVVQTIETDDGQQQQQQQKKKKKTPINGYKTTSSGAMPSPPTPTAPSYSPITPVSPAAATSNGASKHSR